MNRPALLAILAAFAAFAAPLHAGSGGPDAPAAQAMPEALLRPISKVEALNIAIAGNGVIRQAQKDVEAAHGIAIQTRAIIYPRLYAEGGYTARQDSLIEANQDLELPSTSFQMPGIPVLGVPPQTIQFGGGRRDKVNNQAWAGDLVIEQSIYEGGRMRSAIRSSRLIKEQAALAFRSIVADTLLQVSTAYDDVLRDKELVGVRAASVVFLKEYLAETVIKNKAGAVPEFDVLRQEVELANAEALHVRAVGDYRVSKQRFVELLGFDLPTTAADDLSLQLSTPLEAGPFPLGLAESLAEALVNRTEIAALAKEELIRNENIVVAKAGWKPSVQAFAGYEITSRAQTRKAEEELHGGFVGVQGSWALFDGFLTKGRVDEAVALRGKAGEAKAETARVVELQVRTAWSDLRTARAVLDAQGKNVEKAVRALELAQARYDEGAGTQIDVLDSQTALTDARGSYVAALRDYSVSRSGLLRATGRDLLPQ
jgi:outer membrane protein TolC